MKELELYFTHPRNHGFGQLVDVVQRLTFGVSTGVHMGIVVTKDCFPHPALESGMLYLMESTVDVLGLKDTLTGKFRSGFQVRPLVDVVNEAIKNGDTPHIASLVRNPWDDANKRANISRRMMEVYDQVKDSKYPVMNPVQLLVPILPGLTNFSRPRRDLLFCSELVCMLYQKLHVIKHLFPTGTRVAPEVILSEPNLFKDLRRICSNGIVESC
jgi:hypothetical protein